MTLQKCWMNAMRLLAAFHPSYPILPLPPKTPNRRTQPTLIMCLQWLDSTLGITIRLRSQSYLGVWTISSIFLCISEATLLGRPSKWCGRNKEEAELRSRQIGREKVHKWLEASEPLLLFYWV